MGLRTNNPYSPCCSCEIWAEEFSADSPYTLGGDVDYGNCNVPFRRFEFGLVFGGDASAISNKIVTATNQSWVVDWYIPLDPHAVNDGATVDTVVLYLDDDNYAYFRVTHHVPFGLSVGQWFERVGGVDSAISEELSWTADDFAWEELYICIIGNRVTVRHGSKHAVGQLSNRSALGGRHGIITTGLDEDGPIYLNRIAQYRYSDECFDCICPGCRNGTKPLTMTVTISGMAADSCDCTGLNGDYILTDDHSLDAFCYWSNYWNRDNHICWVYGLVVQLLEGPNGTYKVRLVWVNRTIFANNGYYVTAGESGPIIPDENYKIDCTEDLNGVIISITQSPRMIDMVGSVPVCDVTNAQAVLTVT